MNVDKINALKQKGNDAFKMGKLLEAIDNYTEAIDLAEQADGSLKAILYSNRAQAMLVEKRYAEALVDAEESLKLDPQFMKSVLRRATADAKLGNNEKAVKDLREVLKQDPENSSAKNLMAEVSKPAQMNVEFASAHIGHYLRRTLTIFGANLLQASFALSKKLPRVMFLSAKGIPFLQKALNGSVVEEAPGFHQFSTITLPCWFVLKCMKADPKNQVVPIMVSDSMLKLVFEIFHPIAYLIIVTNQCANRYGNLYKFAAVSYTNEHMTAAELGYYNALETIRSCSTIITRLPYLPDIVKLENKTFPNLDTLIVAGPTTVDMKFLELWKKQKWGIDTLFFNHCCPNLMNFERFGDPISNKVTKLDMQFMDADTDLFGSKQLSQVKKNLVVLKKAFPNLTEVIGRFLFLWPNNVFMQNVSRTLKSHITHLATKIDETVKPEWCAKLKILVEFMGKCALTEAAQLNMDVLKRIVDECRREMRCLDHISLHGPSRNLLQWYEMMSYSPALIKMSTKHADFEIAFKFFPI